MSHGKLFKNVKSKTDYDRSFSNGSRLGRGAFGDVYKVHCNDGNDTGVAAIKHVDLTMIHNEKKKEYAKQEVIPFFIIIIKS